MRTHKHRPIGHKLLHFDPVVRFPRFVVTSDLAVEPRERLSPIGLRVIVGKTKTHAALRF